MILLSLMNGTLYLRGMNDMTYALTTFFVGLTLVGFPLYLRLRYGLYSDRYLRPWVVWSEILGVCALIFAIIFLIEGV